MELVINFSGGKDSSALLSFLCEKIGFAMFQRGAIATLARS